MLHLPGDLFYTGLGELLLQQLSSGGDHRHQRETNTGGTQRNGPGDIRYDTTHVTGGSALPHQNELQLRSTRYAEYSDVSPPE